MAQKLKKLEYDPLDYYVFSKIIGEQADEVFVVVDSDCNGIGYVVTGISDSKYFVAFAEFTQALDTHMAENNVLTVNVGFARE